jgi:hypothetical protein
MMVRRASEASKSPGDVHAHDQHSVEHDKMAAAASQLPGNPRRQLRAWLLIGNVIAWLLIILVVRAILF